MTDPRPPLPTSRSLRPALALLAGLGVTVLIVFFGVTISTLAALRGVDPKSYVAPAWTYPMHMLISFLGAMAGGFATARITAGHTLFTTLVLALILLMALQLRRRDVISIRRLMLLIAIAALIAWFFAHVLFSAIGYEGF